MFMVSNDTLKKNLLIR